MSDDPSLCVGSPINCEEAERAPRPLEFSLDGLNLTEMHAMALSLQGLGTRVRQALDAGAYALATCNSRALASSAPQIEPAPAWRLPPRPPLPWGRVRDLVPASPPGRRREGHGRSEGTVWP